MSGVNTGVNTLAFQKFNQFDVVRYRQEADGRYVMDYLLNGERVAGGRAPPPKVYEEKRLTPPTANAANPRDREFTQTDPSGRLGIRALDSFSRAGETFAANAQDDSPSRKAAANLVAVRVAMQDFGQTWLSLLAIGEQNDNRRHALFDPPPADAVATQLDIESRSRYAKLPADVRRDVLDRLSEPGMGQVLASLRRDPLLDVAYDESDVQKIIAAWEAVVRAGSEGAARPGQQSATDQLDDAIATWLWACATTREVAGILANPSLTRVTQFDQYAAYRLLRDSKLEPTDIGELLQLEDSVANHFEYKMAQEAAAKVSQPAIPVTKPAAA